MKKVIALAIIIITLASCSASTKLNHSHYTKGVTKGNDGCAWHR
jgi:hypothetical protein